MSIVSTNIRFNLEKEVDRTAWDYLQRRDKREHRSYSKTVIAAINDYFERRGRTDDDPYLETREKEDAFLQRILETIRAGLNQGVPTNSADMLFRLLQVVQPQLVRIEEALPEDQQEAEDMALDFVNGL